MGGSRIRVLSSCRSLEDFLICYLCAIETGESICVPPLQGMNETFAERQQQLLPRVFENG